ncbi:hypothetical protein F2P81_025940 [Scophthalmus maximus]|uniref:Uncharacterized protein n=1 Tax=Scophthalmus maximus TaxID=52904 RepID=A0A6A4RNU4_SCOMX|nr:hypothetical protein F2P81_025940 [Scophthalmus maximus]
MRTWHKGADWTARRVVGPRRRGFRRARVGSGVAQSRVCGVERAEGEGKLSDALACARMTGTFRERFMRTQDILFTYKPTVSQKRDTNHKHREEDKRATGVHLKLRNDLKSRQQSHEYKC